MTASQRSKLLALLRTEFAAVDAKKSLYQRSSGVQHPAVGRAAAEQSELLELIREVEQLPVTAPVAPAAA